MKGTDSPVVGELADLFVDPPAIGTGVGRVLLADAVVHARARGWDTLDFDADPYAEALYQHFGAVRIGLAASSVTPGRYLPRIPLVVSGTSLEPGS